MKQIRLRYSTTALLFLIFIVYSSTSSARSLANTHVEDEANLNEIPSLDSFEQMEEELMGLEICNRGDVECFKRRMISEAHLDYIYTQHHKP